MEKNPLGRYGLIMFPSSRLEECQIMGSSSDPICSLFNLDRTLGNDDHLSDVLQRPFATDKRGDSNLEETDRRKR